jgi:cobalt/nickel transport system permease protein
VVAATLGLQAGALGVVLQTVASNVSALPLDKFVALMLPIHLAIGVIEGAVTAAVVNFVHVADPEVLGGKDQGTNRNRFRRVLMGLGVATLITGGALTWFASSHPDGLEWAIAGVTGHGEVAGRDGPVHRSLERLQEKLSFLPGYDFRGAAATETGRSEEPWPVPDTGTSVSGLVGGALTLAVAGLVGAVLRRRSRSH